MKCHIASNSDGRIIRIVERDPECGDFCDACGDCIHCYDQCYAHEGGTHFWVKYVDDDAEAPSRDSDGSKYLAYQMEAEAVGANPLTFSQWLRLYGQESG